MCIMPIILVFNFKKSFYDLTWTISRLVHISLPLEKDDYSISSSY